MESWLIFSIENTTEENARGVYFLVFTGFGRPYIGTLGMHVGF